MDAGRERPISWSLRCRCIALIAADNVHKHIKAGMADLVSCKFGRSSLTVPLLALIGISTLKMAFFMQVAHGWVTARAEE